MLVLDEAFAQAKLLCYSNVELFPHEAVSLIESMVGPEALCRTLEQTEEQSGAAHELGHEILRINLLDVQLFSHQLERFGKDAEILHHNSVNLNFQSAQLARDRLLLMVEETWPEVRVAILARCFANKKPSAFAWEDLEYIFGAIAATSKDRSTGAFRHFGSGAGIAFLSLDSTTLRADLGLSSNTLLLRMRVYQKLLHLLDMWAQNGALAQNTYTGLMAWGLLETSNIHREVPQCVEVGSFPRLLLAVSMLDRVLSLGLGVEVLTCLCAHVAGQTGLLETCTSDSFSFLFRNSQLHSQVITSTCGWLTIGLLPIPASILPLLLESGLVSCDERLGNEITAHASIMSMRLILPFSCMRVLHEDATDDGNMVTASNVTVGMPVRVDSYASLQATCQRFDWWDRPSTEYLKAMAGQFGQVVAIKEAYSKHRVGVRVLDVHNKYVVDALPIESLTFEEPEVQKLAQKKLHSKSINRLKKGSKSAKRPGNKRAKSGRKRDFSSTTTDSETNNSTISTTSTLLVEQKLAPNHTETNQL